MGESITLDVNFYIAIAFAVTIYALLIWLIVHAVRKNKIVKNKSLKFKKIKELNKEYYFIALPTSITKTCDSLAEYGKANFDSILKNAILSNTGYYREKLEAGERDFEKYKNYISAFREIMDANSIEEETLYKKYRYFKKKETKLCESIKKPVIETYYLEVKKEYTSPAQRNHYEDSKRYSINELKKYIKPNNIEPEELDLELSLINNEQIIDGIVSTLFKKGYTILSKDDDFQRFVIAELNGTRFMFYYLYFPTKIERFILNEPLNCAKDNLCEKLIVVSQYEFDTDAMIFASQNHISRWSIREVISE